MISGEEIANPRLSWKIFERPLWQCWVRGTAAQAPLDRGWGKPKVEVVSDEAGYVQALRALAAEIDESVRISPNNAEAHYDAKK